MKKLFKCAEHGRAFATLGGLRMHRTRMGCVGSEEDSRVSAPSNRKYVLADFIVKLKAERDQLNTSIEELEKLQDLSHR